MTSPSSVGIAAAPGPARAATRSISRYAGRGTTAIHVATGVGQTQIDVVEIAQGTGFGGEFERAQFWMILKGEGRISRGVDGEPTVLKAGQSVHFPPADLHLCVALSDVTLLIVESDELSFEGPWVDGADAWRGVVSHVAG